jgi:hypothetical protein
VSQQPARLPELVDAMLSGSPEDLAALEEHWMLTLDADSWKRHRLARQVLDAQKTGKVRTGTVFDALEAETGGDITPEAAEAFLKRMRGAGNG